MKNNESREQTGSKMDPNSVLLRVRGLEVRFSSGPNPVQAVQGLDFHVKSGEIFGLMGESGSGKTITAYSILRLIEPPGEISDGVIMFEGKNLLSLAESEMDSLRGRRISLVFQEPVPSLNPVFKIGTQIEWYYRSQKEMNRQAARDATLNLLARVGFTAPVKITNRYPYQLSGGEAQRVAIALALVHDPSLLIADEPTSALDLTVQNQILDLLQNLYRDTNRSLLLISHDLLVIERLAQRIAVMYAGHTVEEAPTGIMMEVPLHPYTQGLLHRRSDGSNADGLLPTIPGTSPDPRDLPPACRFAPRCRARELYNLELCTERQPDLIKLDADHRVRCYLYQSHGNHRAPFSKDAGTNTFRSSLDE
jgi:oligopeptide/dipeptide ABC transporter ATP-binding protein